MEIWMFWIVTLWVLGIMQYSPAHTDFDGHIHYKQQNLRVKITTKFA